MTQHMPEHVIFEAAFDLPYETRKQLVERLLETLEEPDRAKVENAWIQEAKGRLQEYRAGRIGATPAAEVSETLRARTAQ